MPTLSPSFFESDIFFIDEKVRFFKFHNHYNVYDRNGIAIGAVVQRVSGWHKFLRLFLKKALFPFLLEVKDKDEKVLASIHRGWTLWISKMTIKGPEGQTTGYIKQKFRFFKPKFRVFDELNNEIGQITGDWKAWNFSIKDNYENEIGTITKKWAGVAKELFTTADKYLVSINPSYADDLHKTNMRVSAITIDMVLKESR